MAQPTHAPLPVIVLASFAVAVLSGCDASINIGGDTTRRVETETVAVDGVSAIDIATDSGRVDIVAGVGTDTDTNKDTDTDTDTDTDVITIDVVMTERDAGDADYSIDLADGELSIDGECDGGWFSRCSVGFVVSVPASARRVLAVDRGVTVATDNGAITLTDVAVPVDVRTDNGAVVGTGLEAQIVRARTDNGRIDLAFDAAPTSVDVHTDNGAIDLLVPDTGYSVDADSDNGGVDVDVTRDDDAERTIVAGSDNGAIDIDHSD